MMAISLFEPWASLMVLGVKVIETRSWPTSHRGTLLVHAGNNATHAQIEICHEKPFKSALRAAGIMRWQDFRLGCVLGSVSLLDCRPIVDSVEQIGDLKGPDHLGQPMLPPEEPQRSFGRYEFGRYAWICDSANRFNQPIPYKGRQRIFNIPSQALGFHS